MTNLRILVTDDEPHVRRVIRLALEKEGHTVDEANNGEHALEKMAALLPDVLITDLSMPKMGGRALCEAARRLYPSADFPIVIMTSMTERDERSWTKGLTNMQFLEKPISARQLVSYLANYSATRFAHTVTSHVQ